jgi:NarL family two-component system sensor histidine kinase LiaS
MIKRGLGIRSIRWNLVLYSLLVTLLVTVSVLAIILFYYRLDLRVLWSLGWIGLSFFILIFLGALVGFLYGTRFIQRLEQVRESIIQYERGNFSYRVLSLGHDELGEIGQHLNQMAERLEQQVASLQKLTTEKTEWQTKMTQAVLTEERERLARELHDTISQQLFAISMMSSAILANNKQISIQKNKQLRVIEKLAGDAQQEMRALLMHLRPATLEGKGLKDGLEDLLLEVQEKQALEVSWEIAEFAPLPRGIEDHLFRIVQEGLSNVLRHAKASKVHVRLIQRSQYLHLKIIDNGIGFEPSKTKISSYGLKSITERANEIGGIGEFLSLPGKGTQIYVKVPILDLKD